MVKREICPCKDCDNRTAHCHGSCEDYKEWSRGDHDFKEMVKKKRLYDYSFVQDSFMPKRRNK